MKNGSFLLKLPFLEGLIFSIGQANAQS
jgi:hypothetical protein